MKNLQIQRLWPLELWPLELTPWIDEDQGIRASEEGGGAVSLFLNGITVADNNQNDEAIRVEEENNGNVVVEIND